MRGYLPLIPKDSGTHMHGLAVYVKEGLPFARDLSLEIISLETLTSIIRAGLLILVELINLVNSVITFLIQMTLLDG